MATSGVVATCTEIQKKNQKNFVAAATYPVAAVVLLPPLRIVATVTHLKLQTRRKCLDLTAGLSTGLRSKVRGILSGFIQGQKGLPVGWAV